MSFERVWNAVEEQPRARQETGVLRQLRYARTLIRDIQENPPSSDKDKRRVATRLGRLLKEVQVTKRALEVATSNAPASAAPVRRLKLKVRRSA